MHEQSLACALLRQVEELRATYRNGRLRCVRLTVGEFSGIDTELLGLALRRVSAGSEWEQAEFFITSVPLTARCRVCAAEFRVERFRFVCPECAGGAIDVVRGEELMLESVTFEEPET